MAGASAGALTATMAATNVDFYEALQCAIDVTEKVRHRTGGLCGIINCHDKQLAQKLGHVNALPA